MSATEETPENVRNNVTKLLDIQQKLMLLAKKILNPNNDKPYVDEYITATSGYIQGAISKIMTAEDKDKASKEVAKDLNKKLEVWVAERKAQRAAAQSKSGLEKIEPELLHEDLD